MRTRPSHPPSFSRRELRYLAAALSTYIAVLERINPTAHSTYVNEALILLARLRVRSGDVGATCFLCRRPLRFDVERGRACPHGCPCPAAFLRNRKLAA